MVDIRPRMAPGQDLDRCATFDPNPPDMRQLLSRRGFLRAGLTVTAAGAVVAASGGVAFAEECKDGIGTIPPEQRNIQLFTLLAAHLASPHATLAALYQIGYRHVEHIGVYLPDAETFRGAMDNAGPEGITSPTGHTRITNPFDRDQVMGLIEDAHVVGHQWLIDPATNVSTEEEWAAFGETMNQAGQLAIENGLLGVAHHNHAWEYTPFEDGGERRPIDVLMEVCDPAITSQEMDLCWVWSSGTDPVEYLEKYPGRYRWFHVKDMTQSGQPTFPGLGVIDFNRIFEAAARTQQIEQYIIEQDAAPSGFESAKLGWDLLENAEFPCPSGGSSDSAPQPAPGPQAGPAPAASTSQPPLPTTGGGLGAVGLAGLGALLALRSRARRQENLAADTNND